MEDLELVKFQYCAANCNVRSKGNSSGIAAAATRLLAGELPPLRRCSANRPIRVDGRGATRRGGQSPHPGNRCRLFGRAGAHAAIDEALRGVRGQHHGSIGRRWIRQRERSNCGARLQGPVSRRCWLRHCRPLPMPVSARIFSPAGSAPLREPRHMPRGSCHRHRLLPAESPYRAVRPLTQTPSLAPVSSVFKDGISLP